MTDTLAELNPAAIQRQIQALTAQLLTLTTSKATARCTPALAPGAPATATQHRRGGPMSTTRRRQEPVDTPVRRRPTGLRGARNAASLTVASVSGPPHPGVSSSGLG